VGIFGRKLTARQWAEVEERLGALERQMKALTLEWNDAYDRIRHMMGRVAKRAAYLDKQEAAPTMIEHGVEVPTTLNPRLAAIQAKILNRRSGLKTNGGE
jgi:phage-related minor tail protein